MAKPEHQKSCTLEADLEQFKADIKNFGEETTAYKKQWPNYCTSCSGWGGEHSTYDPSPAGISLSPGFMVDYEPCADCVEKGKCPRCGEESLKFEEGIDPESGLSTDHHRCSKCGWVEESEPGLPLDGPEEPYCGCWEYAYYE